ncbi:glutathione S-transferase 1-like [Clavelina lepadiformis]|uniref:glutathione S-transferase 1-like n=1 Tax=Clavelina lepadiformis TaxID=159417 RepID=UPI004042E186
MPTYKLYYFNIRGYAEMCRLLFAEAGVEYEDIRYTREEWPEHKPEMLFGQMPVLFVDGEQIAHSRAIVRYLAREFKLDGGNSLNAAKCDMWGEVLYEAFSKISFSEEDEAKKVQLMASVFKEDIHPKLYKYEKIIKANGGTYLLGEKISGVDIVMFSTLDVLNDYIPDGKILEQHPTLKTLVEEVKKRPGIAKWLKERPVTEY